MPRRDDLRHARVPRAEPERHQAGPQRRREPGVEPVHEPGARPQQRRRHLADPDSEHRHPRGAAGREVHRPDGGGQHRHHVRVSDRSHRDDARKPGRRRADPGRMRTGEQHAERLRGRHAIRRTRHDEFPERRRRQRLHAQPQRSRHRRRAVRHRIDLSRRQAHRRRVVHQRRQEQRRVRRRVRLRSGWQRRRRHSGYRRDGDAAHVSRRQRGAAGDHAQLHRRQHRRHHDGLDATARRARPRDTDDHEQHRRHGQGNLPRRCAAGDTTSSIRPTGRAADTKTLPVRTTPIAGESSDPPGVQRVSGHDRPAHVGEPAGLADAAVAESAAEHRAELPPVEQHATSAVSRTDPPAAHTATSSR